MVMITFVELRHESSYVLGMKFESFITSVEVMHYIIITVATCTRDNYM